MSDNMLTVLQSAFAKAGIIHCKHDTVNEFDFASDVSRMYGVRHVPSFLIFYDGALIDRQRLPDSRAGAYGPSKQVHSPAYLPRIKPCEN